MYLGHYAIGLAAKKAAPNISLGTLFLAVQWSDLLWPILVLLGVEHVRIDPGNTPVAPLDLYDYPLSHSLVMTAVWGVVFAVIYYLRMKSMKGALILSLCVLSHWVLDFITHRPDMPISPGLSIHVGLGLWFSILGTVLVEGTMFFIGTIVYARTTIAVDRTGKYAFWGLIGFFVLTWIGNMVGPPPPSVNALGIVGLFSWLIVAWGYWIDRHRKSTTTSASS
jgi:hypothetical protein